MFTNGFSCTANNLHRKPHSVFIRTSPFIGTQVGLFCNKLVDEIPFRAHNFYPIVIGILRHFCTIYIVVDGLFNFFRSQFSRWEWTNRCFGIACGNIFWGIAIATDMQNLHTNFPPFIMNSLCNFLVFFSLFDII